MGNRRLESAPAARDIREYEEITDSRNGTRPDTEVEKLVSRKKPLSGSDLVEHDLDNWCVNVLQHQILAFKAGSKTMEKHLPDVVNYFNKGRILKRKT